MQMADVKQQWEPSIKHGVAMRQKQCKLDIHRPHFACNLSTPHLKYQIALRNYSPDENTLAAFTDLSLKRMTAIVSLQHPNFQAKVFTPFWQHRFNCQKQPDHPTQATLPVQPFRGTGTTAGSERVGPRGLLTGDHCGHGTLDRPPAGRAYGDIGKF